MSENTITSRERVQKLFAGEEIDRPPCFSGMGKRKGSRISDTNSLLYIQTQK
jgi:hypothetical protein